MDMQTQQKKLSDFVPEFWVQGRGCTSVWLCAFRMFHVNNHDSNPMTIVDLEHTRLLFLKGAVNYLDTSLAKIEFISESKWSLDGSKFIQKSTPEGSYALIYAPFDIDGQTGNEALTRDHIRSAAGLLGAVFGRNSVHHMVFENILDLTKDSSSGFSPVIENPNWFPSIDISSTGLTSIKSMGEAIASKSKEDKNRVLLALRWLHSAQFDSDGVSTLIKYWIAIETLAMPDTSNIKPLNLALAKAYGIELKEAEKKFLIGRVLNLRSKIVHDGLIIPIHGQLLRYIEAVFADLLAVATMAPFESRAALVISDPACDLSTYLTTE